MSHSRAHSLQWCVENYHTLHRKIIHLCGTFQLLHLYSWSPEPRFEPPPLAWCFVLDINVTRGVIQYGAEERPAETVTYSVLMFLIDVSNFK